MRGDLRIERERRSMSALPRNHALKQSPRRPGSAVTAEGIRMESIGRYLRRERELRQVSLEELSLTTRIPLKMLHHIEGDRFDLLPGEVFARGFLRSYARALNMETDEVVARYG